MGGVGNNLFQLLLFLYLNSTKSDHQIYFVSYLNKKNIITRLLKWKIHEPVIEKIVNPKTFINFSLIKTVLILITAKLNFKIKFLNQFSASDKVIDLNNPSLNLVGYFQNKDILKFTMSVLPELRILISDKLNLISPKQKNNVVVHFRWGDSKWAKKYKSYYDDLIPLLSKFEEVQIVTDDPKIASIKFSALKKIILVSNDNPWDDFEILVNSKILFSAPSTFSWWALHLVDEKSEVYLPKVIFEKLGYFGSAKYNLI